MAKSKSSNIKKKKSEEQKKEVSAINVLFKRKVTTVVLVVLFVALSSFGFMFLYSNTTNIDVSNNVENTNFFSNIFSNIFNKAADGLDVRPEETTQELAAVVNDIEITMSELDKRYEQVPPSYKPFITKESLLNQVIDEKILLAEADKENIQVSDETVQSHMENLSVQAGVSMQEFEQILLQNGLSINDAKEFYHTSIKLNSLLEQKVFDNIALTDDELISYYQDNVELFTSPESINVSHLLICHNESVRCVSNLTKDKASSKADLIKSKIDDNNFEELTAEFSDEPGADVTKGNLGWVSKDDPFDQTFLDGAFSLNVGQVSVPIETVFGFHIIKVFDKKTADTIEFDLVKNQINQTLLLEKQTSVYQIFVSELRNESEVYLFDIE